MSLLNKQNNMRNESNQPLQATNMIHNPQTFSFHIFEWILEDSIEINIEKWGGLVYFVVASLQIVY